MVRHRKYKIHYLSIHYISSKHTQHYSKEERELNKKMQDYSGLTKPSNLVKDQARDDQVKNAAGGFVFSIDKWTQLNRFLYLGTTAGSYYQNAKDVTKQNIDVVKQCIQEHPYDVLSAVFKASNDAPNADPSIYVYALLCSDSREYVRSAALDILPKILRIGTHLFHFMHFIKGGKLRGMGNALKKGILEYYRHKDDYDNLAYDLMKYQSRDGWSHRDVFRLIRPKTADFVINQMIRFVVDNPKRPADLSIIPADMQTYIAALRATTTCELVPLLEKEGINVPHECINRDLINEPIVMSTLIRKGMPINALIRNLNRLAYTGITGVFADEITNSVIATLTSQDRVSKSKVHPITVFKGLCQYAQGHGLLGNKTWTPNRQILTALGVTIEHAMKNVDDAGIKTAIFVDVSTSMTAPSAVGITCYAAAAMLGVTFQRTQKNSIVGFFSAEQGRRDNTAVGLYEFEGDLGYDAFRHTVEHTPSGGTDCSLPFRFLQVNKVPTDLFIILTDGETWLDNHPYQAFEEYRAKVNPNARCAYVALQASVTSCADPLDAHMMNFVGFDANVANMVMKFGKGEI